MEQCISPTDPRFNSNLTKKAFKAREYYAKPASWYENARSTRATLKTVRDFLDSAKLENTPLQRQIINERNEGERRNLKRHLPSWQVQSAPSKRGSAAALDAEQNGIFVLDIDCHHGEVLDKNAVLEAAKRQKCALAVLESASGRGLAALVAVARDLAEPWAYDARIPKDNPSMDAAQSIVFEGLGALLGVTVDRGANNPERLRFQCPRLLWMRDDDEDVTPYTTPDALDMIKSQLGIMPALESSTRQNENTEDEAEKPNTEDHTEFFDIHPISRLARAYQGDAGPGSMGTAAAIATIAALVDLKSDVAGDIHAARARAVVIADSGAGKTGIFDAMAEAVEPHGVFLTNPKTTAALRECIRRAGTVKAKGEDGEDILTAKPNAAHVLSMIDEAGDHLNQRSKDPNGLDLLGFFRELHGGHILLEGLKDAPSMKIPAAFTGIVWSTPKQYATFSGQIDGANGEARRVLEFIEPKRPNAETLIEAIEKRKKRRGCDFIIAQIADGIAERFTTPGEAVKATDEAIYAANTIFTELLRAGMDDGGAMSLIFNYATFAAAIRIAMTGSAELEITPEDIRATACILRAAIKARAQLAELEERERDRLYQPESAIWCDIRDRIQSGNTRKDKMVVWLANRKPEYRAVFDAMLARNELVVERDGNGKRYLIRFTTAEEREASREAQQTRPQSSINKPNSADTFKRCEEYLKKLESAGKIDHTRNDNTLRMIAGKIKANADIMKDEAAAKDWFADVVGRPEFNTGKPYTAKDVERLWRDGGLTRTA